MTKYIALLRGVNVGGNNKISMPELKCSFERQGFENVVTYINSGNILFDSGLDLQSAMATCKEVIQADFGLDITVGMISATDLVEAMKCAPAWWNTDAESKHNSIFVILPITAAEVIASVGDAKPEYEQVTSYGNVIFWSAPIQTFSRTRWSKVVQNKAVYNQITIRNANTALKLAALAERTRL